MNSSYSLTNRGASLYSVNDRFGKSSAAYEIDSSSVKVMEMPNGVLSGRYDFTICMWFKSYKSHGDVFSVATSDYSNWIVFDLDKMYHYDDSESFSGCS